MKLNVNGELISSNPDHHTVINALNSLSTKKGGFAILSKDDNTYIQTSGSLVEGFELEYQDGSLDRHFRSSNRNLDLIQVANAFTSYLESNDRWRIEHSWELLDLSPGIFKKPITRISMDTGSDVQDRIKPPALISIVRSILLGSPFLCLGVYLVGSFIGAFVVSLIEDPAGAIKNFIEIFTENGFGMVILTVSVMVILVLFPLILMRDALRAWRIRRYWNDGYSTAIAIVKTKMEKKIKVPVFDKAERTDYEFWLTIQFHPSNSIVSGGLVTLNVQVENRFFKLVEEGGSTPIRYAHADPRIALLQGEF